MVFSLACRHRSTSNGIFPRIEDWFDKFAEAYDKFGIMKLMHGKAALNELQEELVDGVHVDEERESGVLTSQWFAGKKTAILSDACSRDGRSFSSWLL